MIREWNFQMHRVSLSEEIFEKRLDQSEGVSHRSLCRKRVTGRETNRYKDPESGVGFVGSKYSKRPMCSLFSRREGRGQVIYSGYDRKPLEFSFQCHKLNLT